jgi:DNA repair protein RecO (recombination protein O)
MRVNLQPAYVIHRRPYRDTSALLDVFTAEYGRVGLVARGIRRRVRSAGNAALLQPFRPLLVSFSGRSELKTLLTTEAVRDLPELRGNRLFSGMYINELLVRLLHRNDAHPRLFAAYGNALSALGGPAPVDAVLRRFELDLLEDLGYRLELDIDSGSGERVLESGWYRYDPGHGFIACEAVDTAFAGADLLAMARGEFGGAVRPQARRLLRAALAVHLGEKPLRSRELFAAAGRHQ